MAKKAPIKGIEKQKNNPPKAKFIPIANVFHHDTVGLLEKKYRLAMRMKNYEEAGKIHKQLSDVRKQHRNLIHRKEFVKM